MREDVYIKIAYWYYTLGMTQDEIAKRLSFTRQKVNQIINRQSNQQNNCHQCKRFEICKGKQATQTFKESKDFAGIECNPDRACCHCNQLEQVFHAADLIG